MFGINRKNQTYTFFPYFMRIDKNMKFFLSFPDRNFILIKIGETKLDIIKVTKHRYLNLYIIIIFYHHICMTFHKYRFINWSKT